MVADDLGQPLGLVLRDLRRAKRLTGKRVAELTGMSQPKVSRIENGVGAAPSPEDVRALAVALGADDQLVWHLAEQARRLQEPVVEWEPSVPDLEVRQQDTEQAELTATDFKVFQPTVIIGLLQTSGYAAAVLTPLQRLAAAATPPSAVYGAVSARLRRQRILSDPEKRFDFVMSEAALSNRVCPPEEMPAQLHRIAEVARQPNVTISIIPAEVRWQMPPFHGFSLLDERHLFVDLFDTGLTKHDEPEAEFYAEVFAAMREQAVQDIGPILERYRQQFLRELSGG